MEFHRPLLGIIYLNSYLINPIKIHGLESGEAIFKLLYP